MLKQSLSTDRRPVGSARLRRDHDIVSAYGKTRPAASHRWTTALNGRATLQFSFRSRHGHKRTLTGLPRAPETRSRLPVVAPAPICRGGTGHETSLAPG